MQTHDAKDISNLAVWSLVLGVLSLVFCCLQTAIPAIICGHLARSRIKQTPETVAGSGMALAGLITGYVSVVAFILACILGVIASITVPALMTGVFHDEHKSECGENMPAMETHQSK